MKNITFNKDNIKKFIRLYNRAAQFKQDSFTFQEGEFLTKYAYYLIQHLVNEKIVNGSFDTDKQFIIIT